VSLPLPLPCRWCHHDDDEHELHDTLADPTVLCPCQVDGCQCDDYEADE
jgi:hypothetical protein